jgi:hypothetical protein
MKTIHINDVVVPKTKEQFHLNLKKYFVTEDNYENLTIVHFNNEKIKKLRRVLSEKLIKKKIDRLSFKELIEKDYLIGVGIPINKIDDFSDIYSLTNTGFCGDGKAPFILLGSHYSELIDLTENPNYYKTSPNVIMIPIDGGSPLDDPDFLSNGFTKDYIPIQFRTRKLLWKLLGNFTNYDCSDQGKGHRIDMDRFRSLMFSCPIHSPFRLKQNRPTEQSSEKSKKCFKMFKANNGVSDIDSDTSFKSSNIKLIKVNEIPTSPGFSNGDWNRDINFN